MQWAGQGLQPERCPHSLPPMSAPETQPAPSQGSRPTLRVCLLVGAVMLVPILPWLVLGPRFEAFAAGLVETHGATPEGALLLGFLGVVLLAADSFLPVPATLVMSAQGYACGAFLGGLLASLGLTCSGLVAYAVSRRWGTNIARHIAGEAALERLRSSLDVYGSWLVVATRSVPVLQETVSCLAGLGGIPFKRYLAALLFGCVPVGFAYAAVGASAVLSVRTAVVMSLVLPLASWLPVWFVLKRR